jgi:hypothetical protein
MVNKIGNVKWLDKLLCRNFLWLVLFFIGLGILLIVMPKYTDDYWYMVHLRPWFESQGLTSPAEGGNIFKAGIPWDGIWTTWVERYYTDNIRLGNLIVPFFLMLPKWVGSVLMTLCWIYTVFASFRLAGIDWTKSRLVPLCLFLWTFCIPWEEDMGCLDYQFNYLLSTFLGMLLLGRLVRDKSAPGVALEICYLLLGFVVGMSHEGIGVPFVCGIVAMLLFFRSCRRIEMVMSLIGLLIAISLLLTIPGMSFRVGYTVELKPLSSYGFIMNINVLTFLFFISLCIYRILRNGVKAAIKNRDKILVFAIVSSFVSCAIWLSTDAGARSGIWMELMSVVGIVRILHRWCGIKNAWQCKGIKVLSALLLVAVYLHLAYVDVYVVRFRTSFDKMVSWFITEGENSFFGDYKSLGTRPAICGYLPPYGFYLFNTRYFNQYYGVDIKNRRKYAVIVPEELRMVSDNSGVEVEGGSGVRELSGNYFVKDVRNGYIETDVKMVIPVSFDYGFGYSDGHCWKVPFRSEKDGEWYLWLIPYRGWYVSHFMDLKGLKL